ncbi:hypothetical protein D3C71_924870 [compost metagenome]
MRSLNCESSPPRSPIEQEQTEPPPESTGAWLDRKPHFVRFNTETTRQRLSQSNHQRQASPDLVNICDLQFKHVGRDLVTQSQRRFNAERLVRSRTVASDIRFSQQRSMSPRRAGSLGIASIVVSRGRLTRLGTPAVQAQLIAMSIRPRVAEEDASVPARAGSTKRRIDQGRPFGIVDRDGRRFSGNMRNYVRVSVRFA